MAEHIGLSRASRLVAAGLVGALAFVGLPAAGAVPPSTTPNPPPTGPNPPPTGTSTSTVPPRPMAADRSHAVFAPDGCPTKAPTDTLRGLAAGKDLSLYQICSDSVRAARSPA